MIKTLSITLAWQLLALSCLLPAHQALAATAEIPAGLPEKQCSGDLIRNVTAVVDAGDDGQDVNSGVIYKNAFNTGAESTVVCNCPDPYTFTNVTYSAYYSLPDNGQSGNIWAILNESIQLRLQLAIYNAPTSGLLLLPFERFSSYSQDCNSANNQFQDSQGIRGSFDIKLTKVYWESRNSAAF